MAKLIKTEITINAPQKKVWKILEDFESYGEWNRFCSKVETSKKIGEPIIMTIQWHPKSKAFLQKEFFSDYEAPNIVGWKLNWGIFLKSHRIQKLSTIDENTSHYYTEDKFWGLLTPLVMLLYRKAMQRNFEEVAIALKERAENM